MIYPIILLLNATNRGGGQKKLNWQPLSLKVDTATGSVPECYITLNYCVYKIFRTLDLQSWLWAQGHQDSNSSKIFRLWLDKFMSAVHLRLIPPWLILVMSLPCRCKELNQKHSEGEEEEMMKVVWEVLKTVCCSVWTQTYTGLVVSFAHLHDTHAPLHSAGDTELPYGDVNLVSASTGRRWGPLFEIEKHSGKDHSCLNCFLMCGSGMVSFASDKGDRCRVKLILLPDVTFS